MYKLKNILYEIRITSLNDVFEISELAKYYLKNELTWEIIKTVEGEDYADAIYLLEEIISNFNFISYQEIINYLKKDDTSWEGNNIIEIIDFLKDQGVIE